MSAKRYHQSRNYKLLIHTPVLDLIESMAAKATRAETGGVLAGRGDLTKGEVHVTNASEPGPKARSTMFSFSRDTSYCQQFLDRVAGETQGEVDYLGEWHKHHEVEPRPSSQDVATARNIALNP